jgi:hypothetical protein
MPKDKKSLHRQLAVIADFFSGDLSQAQVLTKHRVAEETYRRWQFDTDFTDEMDRRIGTAHRESAALIARVASAAANRLIELMKSPKEEIARRACLNIISIGEKAIKRVAVPGDQKSPEGPPISPESASKLLAVLAEAAGASPEDADPRDSQIKSA